MQLLIIIGLACLLIAVTAEWFGTLAENRKLNDENSVLLDQLCEWASHELHPADEVKWGYGTCSDCGMVNTEVVPMGNDEFACRRGCDVPLFEDTTPQHVSLQYATPSWVGPERSNVTPIKRDGFVGLELDCL